MSQGRTQLASETFRAQVFTGTWSNTLNPLPCLESSLSVWTLPFTSPTPTTSMTKSSSTSRKSRSGLPKLATPKFSTSFWISHVSNQVTPKHVTHVVYFSILCKIETILNSGFGLAPMGFRGLYVYIIEN